MNARRERPVVLYGMTSGLSARGFMVGQAPFLVERGWDVVLACSAEGAVKEFADEEGMRYVPIPLERAPSLWDDMRGWYSIWRTLRRVAPDVAVWGSPKASLLGIIACRLQRVPAIYVLHGLRLEGASGFQRRFLWVAEAVTCRLAGTVVADGYGLRDLAEKLKLVTPGKIQVLADGSANGVSADPGTPHYRSDLGIGEDELVVTFAGRITRDKGIAELIAAWPRVVDACAGARLVVAGRPDPADSEGETLRHALADLPNTHLVGHIDDLENLWAETDLIVLPSYREGLPLVVIEAAAAGVPSVVSDCTGGAEAVEDGMTGVVVPVRDVVALTSAVIRLLLDDDARNAMGRAARERALARYGRDRLWTAVDTLLREVIRPR